MISLVFLITDVTHARFRHNCLLHADDLGLISQSQDRLQNALDHLDCNCRKWKLTINTIKTKSII